MKISIDSRRSTWVPFIDTHADLTISWRSRAEYSMHNIFQAQRWTVHTRYLFSGLSTEHAIPSSQLIIKENGIPLTITQSVASALKDRFQSEEIEDPFVEITDKLADVSKTEEQQKELTPGLIELSWTETITRQLKLENKTGKKVLLAFTVVDNPAESLVFIRSEPSPESKEAPEYHFSIPLAIDEEKSMQVILQINRKKSIQAPVEKPKQQMRRRAAPDLQSIEQQAYDPPIQQMMNQAPNIDFFDQD